MKIINEDYKNTVELNYEHTHRLASIVMGLHDTNYDQIFKFLSTSDIPVDMKDAILKIVDDHKFAVNERTEILVECAKAEEEIFGLGTNLNSEDPSLNMDLSHENETPQNSFLPKENDTDDLIDETANVPEKQDSKNNENSSVENEDQTQNEEKASKPKQARPGQRKLKRDKLVHHILQEDDKKCCHCGKQMTTDKPREKTFVFAMKLLSTETHVSEACRCLNCGTGVVASGSEKVAEQSIGRFHYSAAASLAALRYQYGMASYRMEDLSAQLGIEISDSTQWSLFEKTADTVKSYVAFLEKEGALAPVFYCDDTNNFILEVSREVRRKQEDAKYNNEDTKKIRTGIHTTNVTAEFPEGKLIVYKTGLHHVGEILEKILGKRTTQEQVVIMSDASSSTTSKIDLSSNTHIKLANCNSHAIRKFKELVEKVEQISEEFGIQENTYARDIDFFLKHYKTIFENEAFCKKMTRKERLDYHKINSLPLMEEMKIKAQSLMETKELEPNSDFGKACKYFTKHFDKLCAFCFIEKAPVDNNLCEQMLKSIIRHRKNSLFFRTQVGASVGDIITSILFTAKINGLDSIQYLQDLLVFKAEWAKDPKAWLPWNYTDTIKKFRPLDLGIERRS